MNSKYLFLITSCFLLLVIACTDYPTTCPGGDSRMDLYLLVNKTGGILHYEARYSATMETNNLMDTHFFDTILLPNDTLPLYGIPASFWGGRVENVPFFVFHGTDLGKCTVIIRDDNERILFYGINFLDGNFCGTIDFVEVAVMDSNYAYKYFWTIDSAYIADMACDMSLEDLESEVLQNE